MSKIEKIEQTEMPLDDQLANFAAAAAENLQANVGTLLAYKKRRYLYGKEKTELPLGTELVAVMAEIRHGYIKWSNGKIVKTDIGRVVDGFKLNRDALGDDDQNKWPYDYEGRDKKDPWQKTAYVPMVARDGGALFTFHTDSFYGLKAFYEFLDEYAKKARQHPGCYPVVELNTKANPTKKYGDVDGPSLLIVDWQDKPQLPNAAALAITAEDEKPEDDNSLARDPEDEIPF
jgi:hypothetical protein